MRISDWSSDVCSSDLVLTLLDPLAVLEHRLQAGQAFQRRRRSIAFVAAQRDLLGAARIAFLVEQLLAGRHRDDLVVEAAGLLRRRGALLALDRKSTRLNSSH